MRGKMEKPVKNRLTETGEPYVQKAVQDLGIAAYLMMHGYKVVGRRNRTVFFEIKQEEASEFDSLSFEYLSSPYHTFDSCLMSLKKVGEFDPNQR
jgi:hypothetical protein